MIVFAPKRLWIGVALAAVALIGLIGLSSAGLLPSAISERLADAGTLLDIRDVRGVPINDANYALIERQAHWQAALNMLTAQPWTGVGFSNYQPVYEQYRLLNWPMPLGHAHNIYLNVAAETGLIGLGLYLLLWISIFGLTFRTIRRAHGVERAIAIGLLGTWVYLGTHMLVDNLYVNNTHLMIGVLLGLLVPWSINTRDPPHPSAFRGIMSRIITFAKRNRKEARRFLKFMFVGAHGRRRRLRRAEPAGARLRCARHHRRRHLVLVGGDQQLSLEPLLDVS